MNDHLETARNVLLEPAEVRQRDLDTLLGTLVGKDIDHADLFFEYARAESWSLEEGIVKAGAFHIDRGVGLRAVSGDKTGFACSDDFSRASLKQAASSARTIARSGRSAAAVATRPTHAPICYPSLNPLESLSDDQKVDLLMKVEKDARRQDPRVKEVIVNLSGSHRVILIVRSDGIACADVRPLIRLDVTVFAEQNGRREKGHFGGGTRGGYEFFTDNSLATDYAAEAVRQALVNLETVDAPAGTMVVVLGPGWPGILLHEAIGHPLEGDFNRKGTSAFSGRIGQQVASKLCTIVDDGTIHNRRGSLSIDDEGTPSQKTVLIENGVLKNYMHDLTNSRLMNHSPTGNGRRESYKYLPMPRMTNTYMLPGNSTHGEIIESVDRGIYAVTFGGGQVDITSGNFVFSATEAYLIEGGKLTAPVKGATLIGNGPDSLNKVTMVGDDLKLDSGIGTCGKDGQSVPVGVGLPTVRIDGLTVGGVQM